MKDYHYYLHDYFSECYEQLDIVLENYVKQVGHRSDLRQLRKLLVELRHVSPFKFKTDKERKVFWINTYNLYSRYLILTLGIKHNILERPWIFFGPKITVGTNRFSLDEIEHGILRCNKRSLYGILPQFLPWDERKDLICHERDYRIHFALNWGAVSCPSMRIYDVHELDLELDKAEYNYASANFQVDAKAKLIKAGAIFNWYRNDFGEIYLNAPEYAEFELEAQKFNWQLAL